MMQRDGRTSKAWTWAARAVLVVLIGGGLPAAAAAQERPERRITFRSLVSAVAFSPDGREVLAWDTAGFTRWDVDSGRRRGEERVFAKACGRTPALPRSEDGRTIAVNCEGKLHFFELATGKPLGEWVIPPKQHAALYTASPDGRAAAIVMAGATSVVDVRALTAAGRDVAVSIEAEVEHLSLAPGATRLAVGTVHGVGIHHLPNGNLIRTIEGGSSHALSADGRTVAVVTGSGATIYEIEQGQALREVKGRVLRVRFGASDRLLAGWSNQTAIVWDVSTGEQRMVLTAEEFVGAAVSQDARRLATFSLERRSGGVSAVLALWRLPE